MTPLPSAQVNLKVTEAKRYAGLEGAAWELFCQRTGLVKVPGTKLYNRYAIDLALKYDGYDLCGKAKAGRTIPGINDLQGPADPEGRTDAGTRMPKLLPKVGRDPDAGMQRAG